MKNIFPTKWSRRDLINALLRRQIVPYFQPEADLATGEVVSVEILARWNHPRFGLLAPDTFIPAMEEEALIS